MNNDFDKKSMQICHSQKAQDSSIEEHLYCQKSLSFQIKNVSPISCRISIKFIDFQNLHQVKRTRKAKCSNEVLLSVSGFSTLFF